MLFKLLEALPWMQAPMLHQTFLSSPQTSQRTKGSAWTLIRGAGSAPPMSKSHRNLCQSKSESRDSNPAARTYSCEHLYEDMIIRLWLRCGHWQPASDRSIVRGLHADAQVQALVQA